MHSKTLFAGLIATTTILCYLLWPARVQTSAPIVHPNTSSPTGSATQVLQSIPQPEPQRHDNPSPCQHVLPDQEWHKTPQREAIWQYLFDRLQQGDSPEQLLLMLRDRPVQDKALSQRQIELQYELFDALSRYEGSLIEHVFRQKTYSDFFDGVKHIPPAEKIDYLRGAAEIELTYLEPSGRLGNFQPKTILLMMALHQQQFDKAIADLRFLPRDYSHLFSGTLNARQVEQLLKQTEAPQSRLNLMNLADMAVYYFRDDLLPLLARHQILPSRRDGLYSAMDIAFSSAWSRNDWSAQERKQHQQATIAFLQQLGYPLHGELQTAKNGRPFLLVYGINERYTSYDEELITLAKSQQLLPLQSLPASGPLQSLLQQYQQLEQQQQQLKTACQTEQDAELTAQGLWPDTQILRQIDLLLSQHSAGELPQLLYQLDPALLAFFWQLQDTELLTANEVPSTEADFVKVIAVHPDPEQAAALLLALSMQPTWARHWPNGLAVSQLEHMLTFDGTKHWQTLQQNGFDLAITDSKGRNLYPLAFADSAEAVSLLINAKVPLQQNSLGPDALDLALDASYLQQQLHPTLLYILQETKRLRPSHLARLKRLHQYRPALYQQLQTQFKLPDLTSVRPNPILSLEP